MLVLLSELPQWIAIFKDNNNKNKPVAIFKVDNYITHALIRLVVYEMDQ